VGVFMVRRGKLWGKDEDTFLERNYKTMPQKEIAEKLCRTVHSVGGHLQKLHLSKFKIHYWTKEETDFLKQNYTSMSRKDIAEKLGFSLHSVQSHAGYLHLAKGLTEEKRRTVLSLIETTNFPIKTIAQEVQLSSVTICNYLQTMGIKRKWTNGPRGWGNPLKGFSHNGNRVTKSRYQLLYAYHNTCWDCKRTFVSETDLIIHHDFTKLPVEIIVLCKPCHKKRHKVNNLKLV
jgi:biotin operon repressor